MERIKVQGIVKGSRGSRVIELSKSIFKLEKYKLNYCLNTRSLWWSLAVL